jgi:hypothetical protein
MLNRTPVIFDYGLNHSTFTKTTRKYNYIYIYIYIYTKYILYKRNAYYFILYVHRYLRADCLENVGASTSHNPIGLHGLLQG